MIPLPFPLKIIQKNENTAIFEIAGLYPGYGVTIGNALRRVLLSSIEGAAVTEIKIKGVPHEFSTIPGVLEDVIMIILNVKKLRFKIFEGDTAKIELKVKGEKEVRGEDFKYPPTVKLANPQQHIATLTDKKAELEMEITIQRGIGYVPKEQLKKKKTEIGTIITDASFSPVRRVTFQVENMRVGERTDFDKLDLEIETDNTISPQQAFFEACDILIKHFNLLLSGSGSEEEEEEERNKEEVEVNKISVEELGLSNRTLNVLLKSGIKTVGGIIRKSEKNLLELEGMGEKGLTEIKSKIKKLGLELKKE